MIDLPHDLSSSDYGGALEHDKTLTSNNRHAIDFAAEMAAEFGLGESVFSRSGKINGPATKKGDAHNHDCAAHLSAMGEAFEMLDASAMKALTGTIYYRSGLIIAGTAMIQPAAFVRGVASGLSTNRVQIFENSLVTSLTKTATWTATTPSGRVDAPKVILAVKGHLNSFGSLKNQLMHVFTYASMTRPLGATEMARLGGARVWGITPADPMGTTVRQITCPGGDRIIVRNRFTFDPSMEVNDRRIATVARNHDNAFAARFPMLGEVDMIHRWGGRRCLSRTNVSVVRELEPGLFSAFCQNGLGTTRGTLPYKLAAELATNTQSERLDRALDAPQPTKLRPGIISRPGATALLKWQEFKAGAEL